MNRVRAVVTACDKLAKIGSLRYNNAQMPGSIRHLGPFDVGKPYAAVFSAST
ncbi:Hypothetical protein NGAL_HAMBI1189_30780 [Neorhizobium galegae bv. officinalis]|jgi:hypothetical protein|uniref:Uncharacterized protein n=1 Tax=Neorhizobium galegae bv. officinalis TaxID=323656 RepID=A0A0T7GR07_NEOGA|nr:Hypothetical protein NGAL_HAMBI1189_30780 [Neorhizobium galegae bv. officinalis]